MRNLSWHFYLYTLFRSYNSTSTPYSNWCSFYLDKYLVRPWSIDGQDFHLYCVKILLIFLINYIYMTIYLKIILKLKVWLYIYIIKLPFILTILLHSPETNGWNRRQSWVRQDEFTIFARILTNYFDS